MGFESLAAVDGDDDDDAGHLGVAVLAVDGDDDVAKRAGAGTIALGDLRPAQGVERDEPLGDIAATKEPDPRPLADKRSARAQTS